MFFKHIRFVLYEGVVFCLILIKNFFTLLRGEYHAIVVYLPGDFMNHAVVAGHLGSDPETRFTSSGQKVTSFRVGCRARKDETIWWRITIWGDQFDKMLPYFKKGSSIIVHGEITKPEIFNDKEGKPQVSMQLVANHLAFSPFGKSEKKDDNKGEEERKGHSQKQPNEEESALVDEEIPF